MSVAGYMGRAFRRLRTRGLGDTSVYSYHVARNAALGAWIDLRYGSKLSKTRCGQSGKIMDSTAIQHTDYYVLEEIFQQVAIRADDILVDVGCGDGRVLNYWLSLSLPNRILGIEIDPETARSAQRRYRRYVHVEIACGDAAVHAASGTYFFLYNPFSGETMIRFEQAVRRPGVRVLIYNFHDYVSVFSPVHWRMKNSVRRGMNASIGWQS